MEIRSLSPGQPALLPQETAAQPASETSAGDTGAILLPAALGKEHVEVIIGKVIQTLLKQLASAVQNQDTLLQKLSPDVRLAAEALLASDLPDLTALSRGSAVLLETRRNAAENLNRLAATLQDVAELLESGTGELLPLLKEVSFKKLESALDALNRQVDSHKHAQPGGRPFPGTSSAAFLQETPEGERIFFTTAEKIPVKSLIDGEKYDRQPSNQKQVFPERQAAEPQLGGKQNVTTQENGLEPASQRSMTASERLFAPPVRQGEIPGLARQIPGQAESVRPAPAPPRQTEGSALVRQLPEQVVRPAAELGGRISAAPGGQSALSFRTTTKVQDIISNLVRLLQQDTPETQVILEMLRQVSPDALIRDTGLDMGQRETPELIKQYTQLIMKNIPQEIQKASVTYNLPQLPELWALERLSRSAAWSDNPQTLRKNSSVLRELAGVMQDAVKAAGEEGKNSVVINMTLPLLFENSRQPYPAHIHIFHQKNPEQGEADSASETWIRVSLITEHIGEVDAAFHLYQDRLLNIRVKFSDQEAAETFAGYIPAIRSAFRDFPFQIKDVNIQ